MIVHPFTGDPEVPTEQIVVWCKIGDAWKPVATFESGDFKSCSFDRFHCRIEIVTLHAAKGNA